MFSELKATVQEYAAKYDIIAGVLAEQKRQIFGNTDWSNSKKDREFAAAKEGFNLAHIELVKEYQAKVKVDIEAITADLKKSITDEVGASEIAELQMLMDLKLSEFELQAYGEKYQGKYKALRLLKKISENSGVRFVFTTDKEILDDLARLKNQCIAAINQYSGKMTEDYMTRNTLLGNVIDIYESSYNNFLNPFVGEYSAR